MESDRLSSVMVSLFLGLCKSTTEFRPYSDVFSRELGYRVFRLEPSFELIDGGGTCNPDLMVASAPLANTLLIEWTSAGYTNARKEAQLKRYAKVTRDDLVEMAQVPMTDAETHDVIVIVADAAADAFKTFLGDEELAHVLLAVDEGDNFVLSRRHGSLSREATDTFFDNGISLDRVPLGYSTFAFPLASSGHVEKLVASHLTRLVVRGRDEIEQLGFCRGAVPEFGLLGQKIQKQVSNRIKEVLLRIESESGGEIVSRINQHGTPVVWKLLPRDEYHKHRRHANLLERIAGGEPTSDLDQPGLFDWTEDA